MRMMILLSTRIVPLTPGEFVLLIPCLSHLQGVALSRTFTFKIRGKAFTQVDWYWKKGQTERIEVGKLRKLVGKQAWRRVFKDRHIPFGYVRVIKQLILESQHAEYNKGHEAQRRASYAERVLEALGAEIDGQPRLETPGSYASIWRSKVLTPILQRQLAGIPDYYVPSTNAGILFVAKTQRGTRTPSKKELSGQITISDVTYFYLSQDPLDPSFIPIYRRNLIYTREMRWHCALSTGEGSLADIAFFELTLRNQDWMFDSPDSEATNDGNDGDGSGIPGLTRREVAVIRTEGLYSLYSKELGDSVWTFLLYMCVIHD